MVPHGRGDLTRHLVGRGAEHELLVGPYRLDGRRAVHAVDAARIEADVVEALLDHLDVVARRPLDQLGASGRLTTLVVLLAAAVVSGWRRERAGDRRRAAAPRRTTARSPPAGDPRERHRPRTPAPICVVGSTGRRSSAPISGFASWRAFRSQASGPSYQQADSLPAGARASRSARRDGLRHAAPPERPHLPQDSGDHRRGLRVDTPRVREVVDTELDDVEAQLVGPDDQLGVDERR